MDFDQYIEERHQKAAQILFDNEKYKVPFILYLRNFTLNIQHGLNDNENKTYLEEQIINYIPKNINLVTTLWVPDDIARRMDSPMIPTIYFGEDWQLLAEAIIGRAELIIIELTMLQSEGVIWEIETIIRLNKNHHSVLVLPPIEAIIDVIDHRMPLNQFPRVIWADQLHDELLVENFVIKDLLERITNLATDDSDKRKEAYKNPKRLNEIYPITYKGVLEGYLNRVDKWNTIMALSEKNVSYYKFWDYVRISFIIGIHLTSLNTQDESDLYHKLAYAYCNIIQYLVLNPADLEMNNSFLTKEFFANILNSIEPILNKIETKDLALESFAMKTITRGREMRL